MSTFASTKVSKRQKLGIEVPWFAARNVPPYIYDFNSNQTTAYANSNLTLSVSNSTDADGSPLITKFYRESNGVPGFNYDRAQTIASMERIKEIEKNLKATVIIQHDPRDIGKLPAFPASAK